MQDTPKSLVWSNVSEFSIINLSLAVLFLFFSIVKKNLKSEGNQKKPGGTRHDIHQ